MINKYIGTKIVKAEKLATEYQIEYPGGYISKCPIKIFEDFYKRINGDLNYISNELQMKNATKIKTDASRNTYTFENLDLLLGGIHFQSGVISEGINGINIEDLLFVCLDRLQYFQKGKFPCEENKNAINHILETIMWLNKRTLDRKRRTVEGLKTVK